MPTTFLRDPVLAPSRVGDRKLRDRHFAVNHEHPALMKLAAGVSAFAGGFSWAQLTLQALGIVLFVPLLLLGLAWAPLLWLPKADTVRARVVPALAGLPPDAFVARMAAFRAGQREATVMHQIAKGLDAAQVERLAAWFAAAPAAR